VVATTPIVRRQGKGQAKLRRVDQGFAWTRRSLDVASRTLRGMNQHDTTDLLRDAAVRATTAVGLGSIAVIHAVDSVGKWSETGTCSGCTWG
jgi:hypothetical protein